MTRGPFQALGFWGKRYLRAGAVGAPLDSAQVHRCSAGACSVPVFLPEHLRVVAPCLLCAASASPEACLVGASLCGADLRSAHLQGVDLSNANLSQANLEQANLKVGPRLIRPMLLHSEAGCTMWRGVVVPVVLHMAGRCRG